MRSKASALAGNDPGLLTKTDPAARLSAGMITASLPAVCGSRRGVSCGSFYPSTNGLTVACLIGLTPELWAHGGRATILGQVVDPSGGAVVPSAEVKVIQKPTNVARTTRTNTTGNYEVPGLFPGIYVVEAIIAGFKKASLDDVPVESAQRAEANVTLQVGEAVQSVRAAGSPRGSGRQTRLM